MPSSTWIGKDAVQQLHRQVPYRLLGCHDVLSVAVTADGNLLVEGDNLHACSRCCCPTTPVRSSASISTRRTTPATKGWVYNDVVTAVEMKAWLADALAGHPVKFDDLSRHDKWLCMMYPRLVPLHELLAENFTCG